MGCVVKPKLKITIVLLREETPEEVQSGCSCRPDSSPLQEGRCTVWFRWFPWKFLISRLAKSGGFIDPVKILFRIESFSQPIDIRKPLEMLRSGMVFHARGIMNTSAIQHNLDWIWPYWVERQYNPLDISFVPRSFLITHINITQRNWTAIGLPDFDSFSIVDPKGLVTPFWDSWSLDAWIVGRDGKGLYPSRLYSSEQYLDLNSGLAVVTRSRILGMELLSRSEMLLVDGIPTCVMNLKAKSMSESWLVISVRPYNPEGVSFISSISLGEDPSVLKIDHHSEVHLEPVPSYHRFSYYRRGDVHTRLFEKRNESSVTCNAGMATAASLYPMDKNNQISVQVRVPLKRTPAGQKAYTAPVSWENAMQPCISCNLPEKRFQELFEGSIRTLVLLSPDGVVYPGPYTYKRFWFRDAAFILHALLCLGFFDRVEKIIDGYPARQRRDGFYLSQDGEWDSNGEALWIIKRYCEISGRPPKRSWRSSILRGADWIVENRLSSGTDEFHAGLMPPGFSAEHLGPNDYYYWDDFWGVAGLRAAADLLDSYKDIRKADSFRDEANHFLKDIERNLSRVAQRLGRRGMPASPHRRLDSGSIGSLVSGYPLQIFPPKDPRLMDTADYLLENCLVNDGFFLDIIHSGINPYLTLHLAQVLMRAGRINFLNLFRTVADLASPTGKWPEAIHPRTLGGCMGDGDHAWAAAEWILMVWNSFIREEGNKVTLGSGIFPSWYRKNTVISFGPAPTPFGNMSVRIEPHEPGLLVKWQGTWRTCPPAMEVSLPGFDTVVPGPGETSVFLTWKGE